MGEQALALVFASGWASGVNAYATLLVLGLAERFGSLAAVPDVLGRADVLAGAAIMFLIEAVADKIPYLDSLWDAVHTVVRPTVGAVLGYLLAHQSADLGTAFAVVTGGAVAFAAHLVKAGTRAAVNTSPEPVSNIVVSTGEDIGVVAIMLLALQQPWVAAGLAALLLLLGALLIAFAWRRIRAFRQRRARPDRSAPRLPG